jgi:hypothetical protein
MPLFPESDVIRTEEFMPEFVSTELSHLGLAQPASDYLIATLYADEMPFLERRIQIADVLRDWA